MHGHVAAEAAAGQKPFDACVIPSAAYTDPEVAWVGLNWEDGSQEAGHQGQKGVFPWAASGRAIANGWTKANNKLLFDAESHRILGGGIVGTVAGDLISEVALAVEMGATLIDIAKTIHPHLNPGRIGGHGGRSGRRRVHRPAADEEEVTCSAGRTPDPECLHCSPAPLASGCFVKALFEAVPDALAFHCS